MFGLVTGLVKGAVDIVDGVANSIDDLLFNLGGDEAIYKYKMLRRQGFSHKTSMEIVERWYG